ncbi:hypothetical protein CQ046_15970 [Chryseobacterium sp. MYb7]|nr:hypothetical protein CQ046_15970 [Chryseobacterium sp. MYb7]
MTINIQDQNVPDTFLFRSYNKVDKNYSGEKKTWVFFHAGSNFCLQLFKIRHVPDTILHRRYNKVGKIYAG